MNRGETQKRYLVKLMSEKGEITACQVSHISNANKDFCALEKMGICESKWGKLGKARVKFRFIPVDKIEKAKKYIGITSTDNAQRTY